MPLDYCEAPFDLTDYPGVKSESVTDRQDEHAARYEKIRVTVQHTFTCGVARRSGYRRRHNGSFPSDGCARL